jgi:hypothetical protein
MNTLMTLCGYHPLEMVMHPLGLFPDEKKDDPMRCNRVSHVKDVWVMYPDLVGRITVHLDMHHLEMEANEAGSEGEEAPEELGTAPGANGTTSTMPPSPISSVASTTQG